MYILNTVLVNVIVFGYILIDFLLLFPSIPGDEDGNRFFVYGGMSMLCCPLNDGWILDINNNKKEVQWKQIDLSYDHGEVRCWHTAICMEKG